MNELREMRAAVIDMDGVLWEGDRALPGLIEFFGALRRRQTRFVLATNNASRTPEQYIQKLARMGVSVSAEEIFTSAQATALYLSGQAAKGAHVFAIGEDGLTRALGEAGFTLDGLYQTGAGYVVVGMDRGLSWDKLATATINIRAGAQFVGTNPDLTLPTEHGLTHGNGAILAALQAATGIAPLIVGKPQPTMYQQALPKLGADPATTVAIGDRLDTDILGAVRAGLPSALVLTGVSKRSDLDTLSYRPNWVLDSIVEITKELEE
jgi:4-nitrophenyl phosphatase